MNKSIIAIIIVLALVALGGIYYITRNEPLNSETGAENAQNENTDAIETETTETEINKEAKVQEETEEKQEYIVKYTDLGFSPEVMKIKVGETIVFKNESAGEMWVASATHPTHTVYPEFDAKRGYKNGESYSFIFNKKGEWKYHNHLKAAERGTIVAE